MTRLKLAAALAIPMLMAGCSVPVAPYSTNYEDVQLLKKANDKVQLTSLSAANSGLENISVRGNSFSSPYNGNMVNYIETALRQELEKAGLMDPNSKKVLTATVDKNNVDTGVDKGTGVIGADVTITDNGSTLYHKHVEAMTTWDSSFVGAIAIPNAAAAYPKLVQSFLHKLFSDQDFIAALEH